MQVLYIYTQRNYEAMLCYIHMFDAFLVSATKTHTGYIKCCHLEQQNTSFLSPICTAIPQYYCNKDLSLCWLCFFVCCDFRCRRSGRKRGVTCNSPFHSERPVLPSHPFLHRRRFMSVTSFTSTTMSPQSVFVPFIQNSEAQ